MTGQQTLTGMAGPAARATDPDTSLDAGRKAWRDRSELQKRILRSLWGAGPANDSELWQRLGCDRPLGSVAKRRGELVAEGAVFDTGARRDSVHGRPSIVWAVKREVMA